MNFAIFLTLAFWLFMAGVVGNIVYSCIALFGILRFQKAPPTGPEDFTPPVSILKPLYGSDRELEKSLESFFRQDYPHYEILFSLRDESDEALPVVLALQRRFPSIPSRLLTIGPPRYHNAKVHGLEEMMRAARHEILVISDSDVRVSPQYLRSVVQPLADPAVGLVTCPSRGVPGRSIWSVLEALGMNTQYIAGVFSAWFLLGMRFALGPTMVVRKPQIRELGGFQRLGDYLADDFVLGELIAKAGYRVVLSPYIPDHLVLDESMTDSLRHRLRWERSARYSRPAGYVGQVFTHSLPLALLAWAFAPTGNLYALCLIGICCGTRAILAWAAGWRLLRDPTLRRYWWVVPVQDLLSFAIWSWAFFGREIVWRGARFQISKTGRLEPA